MASCLNCSRSREERYLRCAVGAGDALSRLLGKLYWFNDGIFPPFISTRESRGPWPIKEYTVRMKPHFRRLLSSCSRRTFSSLDQTPFRGSLAMASAGSSFRYSHIAGFSIPCSTAIPSFRTFSATSHAQSWLFPKRGHSQKNRKGRPRVPTGGSTRGTTVVWGDYGLRLRDHDRRISSQQLAIGAEAIKKRLRGERYRFYTRVAANIGVYRKGNESRMGKGKGSFDHWAARVAVSQIVFEISGELHEQVVRDAMRLAGHKLPGMVTTF